MTSKSLAFVIVEPSKKGFTASLRIESLLSIEEDPEGLLKKVTELYEYSIGRMRSLLAEMQKRRLQREPIPARMMWEIGDAVFDLRNKMESLSLQLDNIYAHLTRDLQVKRMWLEKAIIFRRYIPKKNVIPKSLSWGHCRNELRKVAKLLQESSPH